jgi:hypothetical protein
LAFQNQPQGQPTQDQAAMMEQQRQVQELLKAFNIADPAHPGNQEYPKFLGSQPYMDPQTGKPIVDPQTGKTVHALEDTTVASLMKSAALGTYMKFKIEEWQKQAQAQTQAQQMGPAPRQFQVPQG